jgi:hypothetical protein
MEKFNALGRGTQLMLLGSVLLLIDSFFRWQEVEFDLGPVGGGSVGVSAWDNFLGIVMALLTIVLIAWLVARVAGVQIPVPVSAAMLGAGLGALIFVFALLKNLTDDYSTFWSYAGVVLAALIAVGAWLEVQAAGGVETLKSEASSFGSADAGTSATAAAAPAAPPAPAAPAPGAQATAEDAPAPESAADTDTPSTERET